MNRHPVLAITLLTAAVGLAACSGSTAATSNTATPPAANSSTGQTTGPGSSSPLATSSTSSHPSGRCSSIDQKTAVSILGFATAAGISSSASAGDDSGMKKLDGCVYESRSNGSLGYDVVQVNAQFGRAMINAVKAKMAQAGAQVTPFDTGLPNSIAFTQHLPLGVDSQITIAAGDRLITVASSRRDGNVAKAQASATAAAKNLLLHS